MKKFFVLFLILICGLFVKAQFPLTQSVGNKNMLYATQGAFGADSGYVYRYAFPDTATANIGYLKNIPGITIRTLDDLLWMRNNDATAWLQVGKRLVYENGLTLANDTVRWGGTLTDSTIITQDGNFVKFVGGNVGFNILGSPLRTVSIGNTIGTSVQGRLHFYANDLTSTFIESTGGSDISLQSSNNIRLYPELGAGGGQLFISGDANNLGLLMRFISNGATTIGEIGIDTLESTLREIYIKSVDPNTDVVLYAPLRIFNLTQDDTLNQVLVKNSTTNRLFWRDASTFGGGSGLNIYNSDSTLAGNRTVNMNGLDLRFASGGDFIIGNTSSSTAALQVIPTAGVNIAHFGEYLANSIPFILHRKDTVTTATASSFTARLAQFDRRVRVTDNNLTLSDKSGFFFGYQIEAKDSVRLNPVGSDLVYGTRTGMNFTKFPGHSGRTIFQNGTFAFDAVEGHLSMIAITGSTSASNYTRVRGYTASHVSYLIHSANDTMDNYLGYYSTGFPSGTTLKGYQFFAGELGNTDSLWSFYQGNSDGRNAFIGSTIIGAYGRPVGSEIAHPSAQLDVYSTTKGALFPRMTAAQRTAIGSPAAGLVVYDTDSTYYLYYNGSAWMGMTGGGSSINLGNSDLTQTSATRNFDIDDQNLYWLNTGVWRIYGAATHSGDRLMEIDGTNSLGYFGPDAGSVFWGFNADSLLIDGIGLRNDSTNNKILVYNPATNTVSYSNWIGGGGSVSFGTDNEIPYTNAAGTGFDYSSSFKFDGASLQIGATAPVTAGDALIIRAGSGTITDLRIVSPDGGDYIEFRADNGAGHIIDANGSLSIRLNNTQNALFAATAFQFNTNLANIDFRVSGDTETNLFYADASTDNTGIRTNTPGYPLDVNGMINTPGTNASTYRWAASAVTSPTTAGAFSTPTNYFGANITNVLGTPDAWVTINIGGAEYALPAYSVVAP